ncbi:Ubiquitin-conjugating enzyme E2 U, partial [Blyttiomyces sp. JEL0837]
MTSSRATLLLQRECHLMQKTEPPWGVKAEIVLNDLFQWRGTIEGPLGTPWEGAILKDLLVQPDLRLPVNTSAAEIFLQSPRLYEQLCRDCVVASRRIAAGLSPHQVIDDSENTTTTAKPVTIPQQKTVVQVKPKVKKLCFDEYYQSWKEIATSLPSEPAVENRHRPVQIRMEGPSERARLSELQFRDLVDMQNTLWYGKLNRKPSIQPSVPTIPPQKGRQVYNIPVPSIPDADAMMRANLEENSSSSINVDSSTVKVVVDSGDRFEEHSNSISSDSVWEDEASDL